MRDRDGGEGVDQVEVGNEEPNRDVDAGIDQVQTTRWPIEPAARSRMPAHSRASS